MYIDMNWWTKIRLEVLRGESSKREVLRREGIHWETLKKILNNSSPPGYQLHQPRPRPKVGPFLASKITETESPTETELKILREEVDPRTGKVVDVKPKKLPFFKVGRELKKKMVDKQNINKKAKDPIK